MDIFRLFDDSFEYCNSLKPSRYEYKTVRYTYPIFETTEVKDDSVTFRVVVPGYEKEELKVYSKNDILYVSGHRKNFAKEDFRLYKDFGISKITSIKASLKNGILTITVGILNETITAEITSE
jgi:HSP20 family molecular chaperone IbpA